MATIAQATDAAANLDQSVYEPKTPEAPMHFMPSPDPPVITRDIFLRCPLPPINASSDSLRQYYRPAIPQTRIIPALQ